MNEHHSKFIEDLARQIVAGNRAALGRGITLLESTRKDHRNQAERLTSLLLPHSGRSIRIGISGIPGAGKSTFIESFGCLLVKQGHKVAVLAIDPSSERSGGSILGDKTRMHQLASSENAFIRPSPTSGTLGGVTRRTREAIILCEAAGFNIILVETVGVGQSETLAARLVDIFLLLTISGAGDDLQGIKRGILEIADVIAVNKTDGPNAVAAVRAATELKNSLHILNQSQIHNDKAGPHVFNISSIDGSGIDEISSHILKTFETEKNAGRVLKKRNEQKTDWFWEELAAQSFEEIRDHAAFQSNRPKIQNDILEDHLSVAEACRKLISLCLAKNGDDKS